MCYYTLDKITLKKCFTIVSTKTIYIYKTIKKTAPPLARGKIMLYDT